MSSGRVNYAEVSPSAVSDADLRRHAQLFSNNYGEWAEDPYGLQAGRRVRLTAAKLRSDHLFDEQRCSLISATVLEDEAEVLVGHAIVYRYDIPGKGKVSWITQLVVHSAYRQRGVAKKLCRLAWAVDHYYAAGLVTSHPYAVRALERATERVCDRTTIMQAAHEIVQHCAIPYVQGKTLCFSDGRCLMDTQFFVDHTEVNQILSAIRNWKLGPLEDGKEFFAFTFSVSPKTSPTGSPGSKSQS